MGQYYKLCIQDGKYSSNYEADSIKLMETAWRHNDFWKKVMVMLRSPKKIAYVGDYYKYGANERVLKNIWHKDSLALDIENSLFSNKNLALVNFERKEYLFLERYYEIATVATNQWQDFKEEEECFLINPLPLLIAKGCVLGKEEYVGCFGDKVGIWAWNTIHVVERFSTEFITKYSEYKNITGDFIFSEDEYEISFIEKYFLNKKAS